jgi:PIN domain nuclease of toxin-antitoxin system
MRVLLDTLVFGGFAAGRPRLSPRAARLLEDPDQELLLSPASAYEIGVKVARGRLELPDDPGTYVVTRAAVLGLHELPLSVAHALAAAGLPRYHADPWDRLLVAQARSEAIPIMTADPLVTRYDVETIW